MESSKISPVALVTGAAKRVGRAIALGLADAGFDIAFTYLSSQSEADEFVKVVRGKGRQCLAIRVDLTQPAEGTQKVLEDFSKTFSGLNVLVNNASLFEPDKKDSTDSLRLRRLMAIHFESPWMLCQKLATSLRANRGHVINMVDIAVERPVPEFTAYYASKAALWNLTLNMSRELAPEVTVNGIAPGVAEWAPDTSDAEKAAYLRRVPLGRAGTPQDIAAAALYLCTGGSYVTGQILRVDGGRSIT